MQTKVSPDRGGTSRLTVATALLVAGGALLAGCGSSGHASAAGSPLRQTCTAVTAVLGNGPDPGADPVGYAAAQPIELRRVPTSNPALHVALDRLADAYGSFVSTQGSSSARQAVASAAAKVDAICPGATS